MSHQATNWAFLQRGLEAATWRVLIILADRHNLDHGCFPSQSRIATDAEMSRSSLNVHLDKLERAGLIRRERRIDPTTRRQRSTRYLFSFEAEFDEKPCPETGHGKMSESAVENAGAVSRSRVQNLDTNPVSIQPVITTAREPDKGPEAADPQTRCLAAGGPGLCPASRAAIISTADVIDAWLREGIDLEADILPTIAKRTTQIRISPIRTWAYFTDAVQATRQARLRREADPRITAQHRFFVDWINSDRYLPPTAVTNTMARALLRFDLVTETQLTARGVPIPYRKAGDNDAA
jgi:DNA-binding MarR family transcriptional regulator